MHKTASEGASFLSDDVITRVRTRDNARTVDKAMTAAIKILKDMQSSVAEEEYDLFAQALSQLLIGSDWPLSIEGSASLTSAMGELDPRDALINFWVHLRGVECTPGERRDIDHLRTIQTMWRQIAGL